MPTEQKKKTPGIAIASLVFGCLFIIPFLGMLFSLTAIVLGIVALVKISKNKEELCGMGLAVAGIVLGGIGIIFIPVIMGILAALIIPLFVNTQINAYEANAEATLRMISSEYEMFAAENGYYPKNITDAVELEGSNEYTFSCQTLGDSEYRCQATPVDCGTTGVKVFSMDQTGVLDHQNCR